MRPVVKALAGVGLGVAVCAPVLVPRLHDVPAPSEMWLVLMALGGAVMGWGASRAGSRRSTSGSGEMSRPR